jgi:hypothetical protein
LGWPAPGATCCRRAQRGRLGPAGSATLDAWRMSIT